MADDAESRKWFWRGSSGYRHGPVDTRQIKWNIEHGYVRPDSLVWQSGMADWLPLNQTSLKALFEEVELPPPLPEMGSNVQPPPVDLLFDKVTAVEEEPDTAMADSPDGSSGGINDLLAGHAVNRTASSFAKRKKDSAIPATGWALIAFTVIFLGAGLMMTIANPDAGRTSALSKASDKEAVAPSNNDRSSVRKGSDTAAFQTGRDALLQALEVVQTTCTRTNNAYSNYSRTGDGSAIADGDQYIGQCESAKNRAAELMEQFSGFTPECIAAYRRMNNNSATYRDAALREWAYRSGGMAYLANQIDSDMRKLDNDTSTAVRRLCNLGQR